ncbi:hypothetical protein D3C80_2060840 [compost metagenome]
MLALFRPDGPTAITCLRAFRSGSFMARMFGGNVSSWVSRHFATPSASLSYSSTVLLRIPMLASPWVKRYRLPVPAKG